MSVSYNNDTVLGQNSWGNGSLYHQVQQRWAVYPGNQHDEHVNLTIFPNNTAALSFNASNDSVALSFALAEVLLDPSLIRYQIWCVHPLSGQYDTLSRALYYLLLVFSLMFRRHEWLAVAALGTAMTYAATSAVHLFAILSAFRFGDPSKSYNLDTSVPYGDLDIFGIWPILVAAGLMLTPILNWSTTVRKHKAQSVIIWWGVLVFAALVPTLIYLPQNWQLNILPSFATCTKADEYCLNNQYSSNPSAEYYKRCDCIDFCSTLSPHAPMRKDAPMVAYLGKDFAEAAAANHVFLGIVVISFFATAFIVCHGIIGLLESRYSQHQVRNAVFRFCYAERRMWVKVLFEGKRQDEYLKRFHIEHHGDDTRLHRRLQYAFAKFVAASFYIVALVGLLVSPIVLIATVVSTELILQILPASEHSDAIGAWGTWVGAAMVLIAAVIEHYHRAWRISILIGLQGLYDFIMYARTDRPAWSARRNVRRAQNQMLRSRGKLFWLEVAGPFIHAFTAVRRAFWSVKVDCILFYEWWCDTVAKSHRDVDPDELKRLKPGQPVCKCMLCKHDLEHKEEKAVEERTKKDREVAEVIKHLIATGVLSQRASIDLTNTHLPLNPSASQAPSTTSKEQHQDTEKISQTHSNTSNNFLPPVPRMRNEDFDAQSIIDSIHSLHDLHSPTVAVHPPPPISASRPNTPGQQVQSRGREEAGSPLATMQVQRDGNGPREEISSERHEDQDGMHKEPAVAATAETTQDPRLRSDLPAEEGEFGQETEKGLSQKEEE